MKKRKLALFQSVISLLLCFSMLVGTTFAWFTDSVATGMNTIAAGNLDVEIFHTNAAVTDQRVDSATKLFLDLQGDPILWEPGVVSYENLRVANEGDLALAYQLLINTAGENHVLDPESGAKYGLSQILKVGVVENGITATDRDGVVASVEDANWTTLADFIRSGSLLPEGAGESEKTWGIVIYWEPGEDDNRWNLNNGKELDQGEYLMIDLGIRLVATQEQFESDSFGSDYDANAKADVFPEFAGGTASSPVESDGNGGTAAEVTMSSGAVSATVPAGAKLAEGAKELTLSVAPMSASGANITLSDNEAMRSLDVHIEGLAADNTVPVTVTLTEAAPTGLNMGNYKLYHVEDGATVEMILVDSAADFTAHNQFKYDPATGDIVLYMATFSEVAVVAEPAKWEGNVDHSWYVDKTSPYVIANADQLWSFSQIVGGMAADVEQDSFDGKTVNLISDINLGDKESENNPDLIFYPIGYYNSEGTYEKTNTAITSGLRNFEGTFDGQGHTIANFYQNTWEMKGDHNWYDATLQYYRDGMGLFGKVYGGTVKNLTINNFKSDGEIATTGCVAAYADGATFENIAIFNCNPRVYNIGNGGIVGCVGWYANEADLKTTFKNITVDNSNKISALWGSYDVACGGIVGQYYPTSGQSSAGTPKNAGIELVNCHVAAQMDVYNDVCGNYQYYAYRYAGMMIGSIRENTTTVVDGVTKTIPDMTGISATGCTVNYGDWNDYYYCEFEKNGHPSYSGPDDYKFSRVPDSELNFTDSNGNGEVDADERTSVAGCKHNHTNAEDNQAIYLPFHQLFTGYGWGVNSIGLEEYGGITIEKFGLDIDEGENESSVDKFVAKTEINLSEINAGDTVPVYDLFEATGSNVEIKNDTVVVSVTDLTNTGVTADFTRGATWDKGTLKFNSVNGLVKITIQDYYFCNPVSVVVEVGNFQTADRFAKKFNNESFTYRVGNENAFTVGNLIGLASNVTTEDIGDITVTVTAKNGGELSVVTADDSSWDADKIKFAQDFTGLVTVTITDDNYSTPVELELEVVDAVNATTATSATANNVVLLNDCGFSSVEVTGGYTLFGNGFTMTCGSDSASLSFGEFVKLDNGTLDNVQIVCPNYDYAALYNSQLKSGDNRSVTTNGTTRYYNAKSAVLATGNSQILNSRISGGRAALYASNGNVVVDNSRLEGGAVATVIISAANSFVFRDATLIQKPTESTYDSSKTLMGMSVLYLCDASGNATPTKLEGSFVQNAWADSSCTDYMPTGTSSIADTVLEMSGYTHTVNDKECVNLGFAYMPNEGTTVSEPSNITDNRTNQDRIPYSYANVNATVPSNGFTVEIDTYVYTYGNDSETDDSFTGDSEYVPDDYSDIIEMSYSDTAEGLTFSKTYGTDGWVYELNVDLDTLSGYTLDFSKLAMSVNGVAVTDYTVNGSAKPTSPVTVVAGGTTYELTAVIDGKEYTVIFKVTGVESSKNKPQLIDEVDGNVITKDDVSWGVGKCVTRTGNDFGTYYTGAAPVLEGIIIRYWSVDKSAYLDLKLSDLTPGKSTALNGTQRYWEYTAENGDYTLKITNTAVVQDSKKVYAMPVSTGDIMYFVASNADGLVSTGSGARNIAIEYEFKDNNGGELVFDHTWTVAYNKTGALKYSDLTGISDGCVTGDTLVTLADGTQKRVDALVGDEMLLVWDFYNGEYTSAPVAVIVNHGYGVHTVTNLHFSDDTVVKMIAEHDFFDVDANDFVYITEDNAASYVGHRFVKMDGTNKEIVTLMDVTYTEEETGSYSLLTAKHFNCMVEGMLSLTPDPSNKYEKYLHRFAVGENMKYDEEQMQADIEKYGLYTYEDFAAYGTYEQFVAFDPGYLKIYVGKGYITFEDIINAFSFWV